MNLKTKPCEGHQQYDEKCCQCLLLRITTLERVVKDEREAKHAAIERANQTLAERLGIRDPCRQCGGLGRITYGSTATWSGGIGGQMMTEGVCDKCWGSGTTDRQGANLRELEIKLRNTK